MADVDRHHDLLLCLVAIEARMANLESLAPILRVWLEDPTVSLADLLLEQHVISDDDWHVLSKRAAEKMASLDVTSIWQTLPKPLQSTLIDPLTRPIEIPDHDESTRGHTSARPAAVVGGKNDERFNVVSPYAQGGLGEISVAHDQQLGRMVALKQIKTQWADDIDARSRFLQEAQITGRLEHPGIVPVYALGCDASGRPYYAMRFVEGETLQEVVNRFHTKYSHGRHHDPHIGHGPRLLDLRKLLGRLVDVCNTMDYAHNRGIIHRDLKPANILLGKYGETLVVDWGLAKVVSGDKLPPLPFREITANTEVAATAMGAAMGTPAYMSPEQAAGRGEELSPQTDIYSLGVTFFLILTGRLPYEEESVSGVLKEILHKSAPSPRDLCPWIPRSLEAICLKAMAPRPADRYASTAALADDIERWLADEPISAYQPSAWERLIRWWRRR